MEISPRLDGVDGTFNTDTGQLKCVPYPKYAEVLLCFAERANIPFAKIKLHSKDRSGKCRADLDRGNAGFLHFDGRHRLRKAE